MTPKDEQPYRWYGNSSMASGGEKLTGSADQKGFAGKCHCYCCAPALGRASRAQVPEWKVCAHICTCICT